MNIDHYDLTPLQEMINEIDTSRSVYFPKQMDLTDVILKYGESNFSAVFPLVL